MNNKARTALLSLCLIAYLALLVELIIFKYPDSMTREILSHWSWERLSTATSVNLIPFRTILDDVFNSQLPPQHTTLIYNIAAFVPLGVLLPGITARARTLRAVLIAGLVVSFVLEFVQVLTGLGTGDVDDLILNVTGTAAGFALFRAGMACHQRLFSQA